MLHILNTTVGVCTCEQILSTDITNFINSCVIIWSYDGFEVISRVTALCLVLINETGFQFSFTRNMFCIIFLLLDIIPKMFNIVDSDHLFC